MSTVWRHLNCTLTSLNIQPQPAETSSRGNYETSKPAFNLAMNCRRNCASLNELRSPLRAPLSFLAKLFPRHKPTECSWTCTRPDLQEGISWHQNIEYNLAWLAWLKNYKPVEIDCLQNVLCFHIQIRRSWQLWQCYLNASKLEKFWLRPMLEFGS